MRAPRGPPPLPDLDGDGAPNVCDSDSDNDGLANAFDPSILDPLVVRPSGIGTGTHARSGPWFELDYSGKIRRTPFGIVGDIPFAGDWDGDGLDEIGVYRPTSKLFLVDVTGNGRWERSEDWSSLPFGGFGDVPIVGDWDGDGIDSIGVFRPGNGAFYLDFDGSGEWNSGGDVHVAWLAIPGDIPVVGDWNGDLIDDVGTYRPQERRFYLDWDGDRIWDAEEDRISSPFGEAGDIPIAGDWDGDNRDEIGVYRESQNQFYFDVDRDLAWDPGHDRWRHFNGSPGFPITGRLDRLTPIPIPALPSGGGWRAALGPTAK